uniref:Uncharacterized protein n=1 Tax=viral metagenome TaxID=1070528 RepID=A0A6H1ZS95_9ZZZZ
MRIEDFGKLKVGMEVRISDRVRKNKGYYKFLKEYPNGVASIVKIALNERTVLLGKSDFFQNWIFDDFEIELIHENKQLRLF